MQCEQINNSFFNQKIEDLQNKRNSLLKEECEMLKEWFSKLDYFFNDEIGNCFLIDDNIYVILNKIDKGIYQTHKENVYYYTLCGFIMDLSKDTIDSVFKPRYNLLKCDTIEKCDFEKFKHMFDDKCMHVFAQTNENNEYQFQHYDGSCFYETIYQTHRHLFPDYAIDFIENIEERYNNTFE